MATDSRMAGRLVSWLLTPALLVTLAPAVPLEAQEISARERDPLVEAAEAGAPAGTFFEPSVQFSEVYDDNVFVSTDNRSADYIMRLTPGIVAGYRSARALFTGSYNLDAERYRNNTELESLAARQQVSLDFSTYGSRRFLFSVNGGYIDTTTPSELNQLSGIITGRARTERFSARPSFTYRTSPNGRLRGEYLTAYDSVEVDDGLSAFTQVAQVEYRHQITTRFALSTDYVLRYFSFDNTPSRPSHVVALGLNYALTPSTSIALRAGPRLFEEVIGPGVPIPLVPGGTPDPGAPPPSGVQPVDRETEIERSVVPEWGAALHSELRRATLELAFQRTQTTAIGVQTAIDTTVASASLLYRPAAPVELRVSPGFFRDRLDGLETRAYRLGFGFTVWLGSHVALVSDYRYNHQEGVAQAGVGSPPLPPLRQNVISVGLLATARRRPAPPEPATTQPQERR